MVGVGQADLGDLWRNFGDVKASRRLGGGAAGFTHNSHLGMKQSWTENEREFLLLVLVLRVGMQPKPL